MDHKVYYTQFEKELVLSLVEPHLKIIENKETNAVSNSKKTEIFSEITKQFNDTAGVNPRTAKQIRQCYSNIKKKVTRKASCLRQEQKKTGGGVIEIEKDMVLTDTELRFLSNTPLTVPLKTVFDSDTSTMDKTNSQDDEFSPSLTPSQRTSYYLTPSQNTSYSLSLAHLPPSQSTSSMVHLLPSSQSVTSTEDLCVEVDPCDDDMVTLDEHTDQMPKETLPPEKATETPPSETAKETPKGKTLRDSLMMFRKVTKKNKTAPSAAARAAACIEAEHVLTKKCLQKDEERKQKKAEADELEQNLRMELLMKKIKLVETKTLIHEKILEQIDNNPSCLNILNGIIREE